MRFVLEMDGRLLELAEAFHEAFLVGVDQDIVDGRILEQGLDRPEPDHLVDDFLREHLQLPLVEGEPLRPHVIAEIGTNLAGEILARKLFQRCQIELVDDPRVQLELLVEQCRTLRDHLMIDEKLVCGGVGLTRDDFRDRL